MSFQILYLTADRSIVGVGPFDGWQPPDGYAIATLDDSEYDAVLNDDPAYLCADGQTVGAQPC